MNRDPMFQDPPMHDPLPTWKPGGNDYALVLTHLHNGLIFGANAINYHTIAVREVASAIQAVAAAGLEIAAAIRASKQKEDT